MAFWNKWKKKRRRYYDEKLRQYLEISEKYGLGLTLEERKGPAWSYADKKAKSEKRWYESFFGGNFVVNLISLVVVVVISVVFTPASGAAWYTWAGYVVGVAGMAATWATSIYMQGQQHVLAFLAAKAAMISDKTASLQNLKDAKYAKDQITHFLIYCPYEIFANGSIYLSNAGGSETYSPNISYDTNKGILGQYTRDSLDEKLMNRGQVNDAGNINFYSNLMQLDIPLTSFDLPLSARQDTLEERIKRASERIAAGFNELIALYFNINNTAEKVYKRIFKEQVEIYYPKMIQNDFLDKMKAYSRGQRMDFDFLHLNDFKGKEQSEEELATLQEKLKVNGYETLQNGDYTAEEKAWYYIDSIMETLNAFIYYYPTFKQIDLEKTTTTKNYTNIAKLKNEVYFLNESDNKLYFSEIEIKKDEEGEEIKFTEINIKEVFEVLDFENEELDMSSVDYIDFYENYFLKHLGTLYSDLDLEKCGLLIEFENIILGIVDISEEKRELFFTPLPKSSDLDNFDFSILDELQDNIEELEDI
ncbi:hypothetical protein [Campylobacter sp. LR286c]|uniref:hypothetical protein n=1 Tax=Campylobacter sp. LR286c TaxID=2593545 RepID=UPI001237D477|nr:hypothetical protein [Campylobacter sp. LR286c]KAA6225923.1 hypothetical protein FMM57_06880 [Campylobacter sp. LR286c]